MNKLELPIDVMYYYCLTGRVKWKLYSLPRDLHNGYEQKS